MTRTILFGATVHTMDHAGTFKADLAIEDGKIVSIGDVDIQDGDVRIDCSGRMIAPALTDVHTHIYWGGTALGVKPERVARRSGTGVFVDAGSSGAGNVLGLDTFIFRPSPFYTFAFLNVSFPGIFGFAKEVMIGEAEDLRLLDKSACIEAVSRHKDILVGLKVRAGKLAAGENGGRALEIGLEIAETAGLPLMCHVDFEPPTIETILDSLRPGDIITHCFRPAPNAPVKDGLVKRAVWAARERGVHFDIGHGMGGFSFETCRIMLGEGMLPDLISSDIHCLSIDGPAFDVLTTLNKLVALGLDLDTALKAATSTPAAILKRPPLGRIRAGEQANLAILAPGDEPSKLTDATGETLILDRPLTCAGLVVKGMAIDADGLPHPIRELKEC